MRNELLYFRHCVPYCSRFIGFHVTSLPLLWEAFFYYRQKDSLLQVLREEFGQIINPILNGQIQYDGIYMLLP